MNQLQTFILAIAVLIAGVVLFVIGQPTIGGVCVGATVGLLAPSGVTGAPKP